METVATFVPVGAPLPCHGNEEDPLHTMRGLPRHGTENLTDRQQQQRILAGPREGHPDEEALERGHLPLEEDFHLCPIPESPGAASRGSAVARQCRREAWNSTTSSATDERQASPDDNTHD